MNQKVCLRSDLKAYLFILPSFVLVFVFVIVPIIRSAYLSFHSWDMVTAEPVFVGFRNYIDLFSENEIFQSIWRTFYYSIIVIPFSMIIGLALSLAMSSENRLNVFYRTIFFSPRVTSMVAISAVWLYIYHPQYGLLNRLLEIWGIAPVRWLNDTNIALISLAVITIWKQIGFCTVVYLGGIQNIEKEVLEAAKVDGADRLKSLWYIKLPMISPTTFMLTILMTIDAFKVFTQIEVMTQGGPAQSTQNLVVMLYKYGFIKYSMGHASTVGMVLFGIILTINFIQMLYEKKVFYGE